MGDALPHSQARQPESPQASTYAWRGHTCSWLPRCAQDGETRRQQTQAPSLPSSGLPGPLVLGALADPISTLFLPGALAP